MVESTQVLIVGAGPVGLTAAILLRRLGVDTTIIDVRDSPIRSPAAHVVNARTFEIWRQAGIDVDRLRTAAKSPADAGFVRWVTQLGGELIGSLPFERQDDEMLSITPTPLRNLSQHHLEPMLLDEARGLGADVRYGQRWLSCQQTNDEVSCIVESDERPMIIEAQFLLACDGASSPVRRSLGIEMDGPRMLQQFVMVHFEANLRELVGDNLGVLHWICDPAAGGTFVAHDIDREWVYMRPFDAEREPIESFTEPHCEALVRAAMVRKDIPLMIRTISSWTMTAQIAQEYSNDRVFLVGDSAHRFPPTGGLGLNTGIADAHNIAWKLAAVLRADANRELLTTYEIERRPIAQHNCGQSLANAIKLAEVPVALGADPDVEVATLNLKDILASPDRRAAAELAIANQATHFDLLGLQLGAIYSDGCVVADGRPATACTDPARDYAPSSQPGARLPHGWIERHGVRCSTLDLVPIDSCLLLRGPQCDVESPTSLPQLTVNDDFADPLDWWGTTACLPQMGALLIRPDQHVLARWYGDGSDDTNFISWLSAALDRVAL